MRRSVRRVAVLNEVCYRPSPMRANRTKTAWRTGILLVLLVGGTLLYYQHTHSVREVRYVLPVGYHGFFWLYETPTGATLRPVHGRVTVQVPPDGVVRVSDTSFLHQMHSVSAEDTSGHVLFVGDSVSASNTYVWENGSSVQSTTGTSNEIRWVTCFVGSPAEQGSIDKNPQGIEGDLQELKSRLGAVPSTTQAP